MSAQNEPNAVWAVDFKGQFKTRDGVYCYPLTVTDGFSRYLIGCQGACLPHPRSYLSLCSGVYSASTACLPSSAATTAFPSRRP